MAINTLAYATLFQKNLDKLAVQEMLTGWMDANAGQVIYNGGSEVKIPKMNIVGLGDYDRDNGYTMGGVTLDYETKKMTQDRGRSFQLDEMDVNETNFVATASTAMGEFQRTQVVPEIDAYRLSKIASTAVEASRNGSAKSTVLASFKEGIKAIREAGYNGQLIIHATYDIVSEFELEMAGKLTSATFSNGGVDTRVPSVDGAPIIATPSNRMVTAITLNDGKTSGQEAGGFKKAVSASDVDFLVMAATVPIAVTKQDKMRIFDPNTNQKANAWGMDYRRYHDLWVLDNKTNGLYVQLKA